MGKRENGRMETGMENEKSKEWTIGEGEWRCMWYGEENTITHLQFDSLLLTQILCL